MKKEIKVFFIAGESSGDFIGARLIAELQKLDNHIEFFGIGGERMLETGLVSIFPMSEISVMGFMEIIPHIFRIKKRINQTVEAITKIKPDIIITIDSPVFCMRVVKHFTKQHIKLLHYVAPTVWAYKENRAKKLAAIYDHLLVLLPFESKFFIKEGLETTFVGHPLLEKKVERGAVFRELYNIQQEDFILCISPGSREGEVKTLLPIFLAVAEKIADDIDNLVVVIPTFNYLLVTVNKIIQQKNYKNFKLIICDDKNIRGSAISASNMALSKCGTITNEFAIAKVPVVAAYKVNKISALILKRMLKIKYVSLLNILAEKEIIPEFLQEKCTETNLYNALSELFSNKELQQKQIKEFEKNLLCLNNEEKIPPSKKAAMTVLSLVRGCNE